MHTLETKEVGRFTVKLHLDDFCRTWEDVLYDKPILVFTQERYGRTYVQHDNTKDVSESMLDVLRLAEDSRSWEDVLDELDADYRWTKSGSLWVDSSSLPRVRYFKDAETAVRSIFRADHGKELKDFRLERFDTRSEAYFLVWYQLELDRYAGGKDATFPRETVQAYLDGEVYGWTVEDADGDILESCWGYIGDASHCIKEGEDVARGLEADALKQDAAAFAASVESSRPDMYAIA